MSRKNNLDYNRMQKMVHAYLYGEPQGVAELEKMAERLKETADIFAAMILGYDMAETVRSEGVVTAAQEQYFRDFFKKEVKLDFSEFEQYVNSENIQRFARLLGWGHRFPSSDDYDVPGLISHNYDTAICRMVYAWTEHEKMFPEDIFSFLLKGELPKNVTSYSPVMESAGYIVPLSLFTAIKRGLLNIPEDVCVRFVLAYARWYPLIGDLAYGVGLHAVDLSKVLKLHENETLKYTLRVVKNPEHHQHLAAVGCEWAAFDLGVEMIPLAVPYLTPKMISHWIAGLVYNLATGTVEEDVLEYQRIKDDPSIDSIVVKYALSLAHQSEYTSDPSDPFGPEVNAFGLRIGRDIDIELKVFLQQNIPYYVCVNDIPRIKAYFASLPEDSPRRRRIG